MERYNIFFAFVMTVMCLDSSFFPLLLLFLLLRAMYGILGWIFEKIFHYDRIYFMTDNYNDALKKLGELNGSTEYS